MKSVLICAFLALAKSVFAGNVCNQEVPDNAVLTVTCDVNQMVKYPNYSNMTTYYTCFGGQPQLQRCPPGQYFCYYTQKCVYCSNFIAPPQCAFFEEKTQSKCSSNEITTTKPTRAPATTKEPTSSKTPSTKDTTTVDPNSTKAPITRPTKSTRPTIPTPPNQSTSGIPMPPMVVTPVPGIPTPPNENVTPPSIPGTPPMITAVQSI